MRGNKPSGWLSLFAVGCFFWTLSPALPAGAIDLSGKINDASDGRPLPGATVAVLGQSAVTDGEGNYILKGLPATHEIAFRVYQAMDSHPPEKSYYYKDFKSETGFVVLAASSIVEEKGFLGFGRRRTSKAEFKIINLAETIEKVDLSLRNIEDESAFCSSCHPLNEYFNFSSVNNPELSMPQVNEAFYQTHRYKDVHPMGQDMSALQKDPKKKSLFVAAPKLNLVKGKIIGCPSCHTYHDPTPHGQFAVREFNQTGQLCQECHR